MKDHPTETIILEVANETDNASTDCQLLYVDYLEPSDGASAADGPVYAGKHEARVTLHGAQSVSFGGTYSIGKRPVTVRAHDQVVEKDAEISQGTNYASLVRGAGGYHPVKGDDLSKITLDPQGAVSVGGPIAPTPAAPTGDSIPRTLLIAIALLAIASIGVMRFASKRRTDA